MNSEKSKNLNYVQTGWFEIFEICNFFIENIESYDIENEEDRQDVLNAAKILKEFAMKIEDTKILIMTNPF